MQLERASRALSDCSVFVSQQDLDTGMELGIVPRDAVARGRAVVIRDPVDLGQFSRVPDADAASLRVDLGADRSTQVVSLVQRLSEPKTPLVFVEAMKKVIARSPGVAIWIVGDGALRPATERAVAEAGLDSQTRFLGLRKDIPALLTASDVVVHSSLREGLPLVVLEAFSVGAPLVATDVGGVAEVVKDGENGLLVPPADPGALARAIAAVLDGPADARRRADAAKGAVLPFSATTKLGEQHELYLRLLGARGVALSRGLA